MCGRYALMSTSKALEEAFDAKFKGKYKPRYNAAPSQNMPIILNEQPKDIIHARWGLIPFWAKDEKIGNKLINARAETITEKPSFRTSFKSKRCLVLADAFYEWKKGKTKQPYAIMRKDKKPFAFAGLWSSWKKGKKDMQTFTIITCDANPLMKKIHHRMPVILRKADEQKWLNEKPENVIQLLKPYTGALHSYEISTLVNIPKNDSIEVLAPAH